MELSDMMAQDAEEQKFKAPSDADIMAVSELANKQLELEAEVIRAEENLKLRKEELARIREVDLPNALESFGLTEIKLTNGSSISIKEEVYCGITEENRDGAYKWLEQTGNDGIIKNEVKCPFGKGQDADAKQLLDLLSERGFSFTNARTIHSQTLKAFVKRQMEDGKSVPEDLFSIHVKKIANIKQPKK